MLDVLPDDHAAARAAVALLAEQRGLHAPIEVDAGLVDVCRAAWQRAQFGSVPTTAVGWLHERALGAAPRERAGAWFTPPQLVDVVLDAALEVAVAPPERVCDPACGAGAFLLAALDRLARDGSVAERRRVAQRLHGADTDGEAVALCRALLWLAVGDPDLPLDAFDATVLHGDSLTAPLGVALDQPAVDEALQARAGERPAVDWHRLTDGGERPFDLVVGNPPWLRGRTHAQLDGDHRRLVSRLHETCHGSTWNLWVPFVERALALADGPVALLAPSSLLGAGHVARLHAHLRTRTRVHAVHDLSSAGGFDDAEVHTAFVVATPATRRRRGDEIVAFVQHRREPEGGLRRAVRTRPARDLDLLPDGHWTLPFADLGTEELEAFLRPAHGVLGEIVEVADGMEQDQAYALRDLVVEAAEAGTDDVVRLVTTGAIDPGTTTWGEVPVRFLGTNHVHPVVRRDALAAAFPRLAERAASPKVAVAGLARRLEAVADPGGVLLVGKSAMLLTPVPSLAAEPGVGRLVHAVAGFLNDASTTRLYRAAFGGLGFGGGSFNVRPPGLRRLPLPGAGELSAQREHALVRTGGRTPT